MCTDSTCTCESVGGVRVEDSDLFGNLIACTGPRASVPRGIFRECCPARAASSRLTASMITKNQFVEHTNFDSPRGNKKGSFLISLDELSGALGGMMIRYSDSQIPRFRHY